MTTWERLGMEDERLLTENHYLQRETIHVRREPEIIYLGI